jgi:beta-glucosidase
LAFHHVDARTAPARARLRVARTGEHSATITIRAGDPVGGRVVGAVTVEPTGSRHAFTEVTAALAGLDGIVDLYLAIDAPGTVIAELTLTPPE